MRRKARCTSPSLGVEALEGRTLLSMAELLVRFAGEAPSRDASAVLAALGASVVRTYDQGPSLVQLAPGVDPALAARRLSSARGVVYAEPDGSIQVDVIPFDDTRAGELWGLDSPNDVDIDAPEAWQITTGVPSVVVAVIDSGFDLSHPDLFNKVWVNPGEVPGNGLDDDRDGKIDDVFGWNFLSNNNDIRDTDGHGTHVSGTIAAVANNATGITGIAPGVRIMPLKFIGPGGGGAISNAVDAIYYAVDHGARVINASWGSNEYSQALTDAIRYAASRDVVFVTAAGNQAVNNDRFPSYPPNITSANLLSVAAIDTTGGLADFSNYGPRTVQLAAPGVNILSTVPGGGYARYTGTSMAAPHVAAVAALVISRSPRLSAGQVVQTILANVKPLPGLAGRVQSGGIVDAYRALTGAPPTTPSPAQSDGAVLAQTATLSNDDARSILLGSDAYFQRNGGTPRGFLRGLYRDVLGKRLDFASQARWLKAMRRGVGRQQVARAVLNMPQAQRLKVAGWLLNDLAASVTPASLVNRPDVAGWAGLLVAGQADADVRAAILGSASFWARSGSTPEGFANLLYAVVLGRAIRADELSATVGQIQAGLAPQEIARSLLGTLEARRVQVARWYQSDLGWSGAIPNLAAVPEIAALAAQIRP
jgi:thermitase